MLIDMTVEHHQTPAEARARLATAVAELQRRFGALIQKTSWNEDRSQVRLEGPGFWATFQVGDTLVQAQGDLPVLGKLLGQPVASGVRQIVEQTFRRPTP